MSDGFTEFKNMNHMDVIKNFKVTENMKFFLKSSTMGGHIKLGSVSEPVQKNKKHLDNIVSMVENGTFITYDYEDCNGNVYHVLDKPVFIQNMEFIVYFSE